MCMAINVLRPPNEKEVKATVTFTLGFVRPVEMPKETEPAVPDSK